jgi:hypothetical protein
MEEVWKKYEAWYKIFYSDQLALPVRGFAANAYEAGWKAAQQSVQLTAFGVGFVSGLLFFGLVLAMVLFIIGGN